MSKYINFESSQDEMKLVQMGAVVKQINSKMCYVKFMIDNIKISYVYNINKECKYFLERISPYPLPLREFKDPNDMIEIIGIDIKQFKNAAHSRNINEFIHINTKLNKVIKEFEDLFLYYNVPRTKMDIVLEKVNEIHNEIIDTKKMAKRVFYDKEPDNI